MSELCDGQRPEPVVDPGSGEEFASRSAWELEDASSEDILQWAAASFPGSFALTCSMGDTVLAHLAGRAVPGIPVLFLDTGYHFVETIQTLNVVRDTYPVEMRVITPDLSVSEQDRRYGPKLHDRDPDLCCHMRKVRPLDVALKPFEAWGSGLRRDESEQRQAIPVVEWDARRSKVKVNPLARWTAEDVRIYTEEHATVANPLLAAGYSSIGCAPCTRPVGPGEDPRSGRWPGFGKTECGIHDLLASRG